MSIFLSSSEFCQVVGIAQRRFDQRRVRDRAASDVAEAVGSGDHHPLPVAATEHGAHGRFSALDAVRLRAVVELEAIGFSFSDGCRFVAQAHITAFSMHVGPDDFIASRWAEPDGRFRHIGGTLREIGRALPAQPVALVSINVSAISATIAGRAALLGLTVAHGHFHRGSAA